MPEREQYRYTPLRDPFQQIRLLKLKGPRSRSDPLVGTLSVHTIPMRDAPRSKRLAKHLGLPGYLAVSYVWGTDFTLSHEIIIDKKRFPITANLDGALRSFRSVNPAPMRYWVDAVCINQADNYEKSAQIPLMRDIFHVSVIVWAWLGIDTPESIRVSKFLEKFTTLHGRSLDELAIYLANVQNENEDGVRPKLSFKELVQTESERVFFKGFTKVLVGFLRSLQIAYDVAYNSLNDREDLKDHHRAVLTTMDEIKTWSPNEEQLKAVEGTDFQEMATLIEKCLFVDTEYFNRMWTLQEICVADRGLSWVLGLPLSDVLAALLYLQRTHDINVRNIEKIATLIEVTSRFNLKRRQSLRTLLAASIGRVSTDPRDRIYALEGLMKDEISPLLQPAYTKSVQEVYANASRHIIFTEKCLDVLCGHPLDDRLPGLPSWVPDFRHFGLNEGSLVDSKQDVPLYKASLSEHQTVPSDPFELTRKWRTLAVSGLLLGTILDVSDTPSPSEGSGTMTFVHFEGSWANKLKQSQEWTKEDLDAIENISDLVKRYSEYHGDSDRATFGAREKEKLQKLQAMTEKAQTRSTLLQDFLHDLPFKYLSTLTCGRMARGLRSNNQYLAERMKLLCNPNKDGLKALESLCQALDDGTRGRRLIIAEENRIGAAPDQTQKGDAIYILIGCSVPVILRKTNIADELEFVGECYLYGFMDGEAFALRDEGKISLEELKLV